MASVTFSAKLKVLPSIKSCFAYVSKDIEDILSRLGGRTALLIKVADDRDHFLSWGKWFANKVNESATLYVGRKFANQLAIQDKDVVTVTVKPISVACTSLDLHPVNIDDWDLLERNAQIIEQKLLDQIRFIYEGLQFPFFVTPTLIVNLQIGTVHPQTTCAYLEPFTEVHVLPQLSSHIAARSLNSNDVGRKSEITRRSKSKTQPTEKAKIHGIGQTTVGDVLKHIWGVILDDGPQRSSGTDTSLTCSSNDIGFTTAKLRCCCFESMDDSDSHGRLPFMDSSVAVVSRTCFSKLCADGSVRSFIARLEPNVTKKIQEKEPKVRPPSSANGSSIVQVVPSDVDVNGGGLCLFLHELTRQDIAVHQGHSVIVSGVTGRSSQMHGIILQRGDSFAGVLPDVICQQFVNYVKKFCEQFSFLLLTKMTIVKLQCDGLDGIVAVSVLDTDKCVNGEPFYKLTAESIESAQIALAKNCYVPQGAVRSDHDVISQLTRHVQSCFSEEINTGMAHIKTFFQSTGGPSLDAMLIHGSSEISTRGCGKTSVAKAFSHLASKSPVFAAQKYINCVELRGKKADSIFEIFSEKLQSASNCQPCVLILDGLDELICRPDTSQDAPFTIFHYDKLAEGLRDMLLNRANQPSKILLLATTKTKSSLHPILIPTSGWHLFSVLLEIRSLNEEQRWTVMHSLLEDRKITVIHEQDKFKRLAVASTQGFTAADLEIVVQRAYHAALMTSTTEKGSVSLSDLEAGLFDMKPCAVQSLALHKPPDITWEDVGGLDEAKQILTETIIWPSKYSKLFRASPLRLASGILLCGAPGTGKTLVAGAVANECRLNFLSIKGPELLSKFVGSSEQNIRDLFSRAQSAKPCMLFFDEFDSLAPRRGHDNTGVTDRVVNQLLTQLDGVEELNGVFVVAASSRPDLIDPALLRPGRLDKTVVLNIPDEDERFKILQVLARRLSLSPYVSLEYLSRETMDFTGADLKAMMYNAQVSALHRHIDATKTADTNGSEDVNNSTSHCITLNEDDFTKALSTTSPSLPEAELKRYGQRFGDFAATRTSSSATQKVTLA